MGQLSDIKLTVEEKEEEPKGKEEELEEPETEAEGETKRRKGVRIMSRDTQRADFPGRRRGEEG